MSRRESDENKLVLLSSIISLLLVAAAIVCEYSGLDLALARHFYDPGSQSWPWHDHWLTKDVLHSGGRTMLAAVYVSTFALLILSFVAERLKAWRRGLTLVLVGGLSGTAMVAIMKHYTHIYVPRKLIEFGGTRPYVRLFDPVPAGLHHGNAFPAGHAAGGYGLFCLYFLFLAYCPRYRWLGLATGLATGLAFGLAQQARGEHFLSHDLISAVICWWSAALVYTLIFRKKKAPVQKENCNAREK
jgi:membrane-associated PAP2 superfamily phosphatase